MKKTLLLPLMLVLLTMTAVCSCEHEIDFDYPTSAPQVVFDGCISNEGVYVAISRTRPMNDSTKNHFVADAQVWITSDNGVNEQLVYDVKQQHYRSTTGLKGVAGDTYHMRAQVDDRIYEATTKMMPPAKPDTIFFRWMEALQKRFFFVAVKGQVAIPDQRNYYLLRLIRNKELYKWNAHSGRSDYDNKFEYDIVCGSEQEIDKGKVDEQGKRPLAEGDSVSMEVLSIDKACCDFYQSLSSSESTTTNALTNIRGGAQGIFMAASISRTDTLEFRKQEVLKQK
jgi:hypothetical protein